MRDEFVPLARYVHADPPTPIEEPSPVPAPQADPAGAPDGRFDEIEETLRAARRFRAGLADAIDAQLPVLLRAIAGEVLARELELREADLRAIVRNELARAQPDAVLTVRVHPSRVGDLRGLGIPPTPDQTLATDCIVIALQSGTIDMRLDVRLERALAACLP